MGMILGTAAYMSPEQAAGKPVDKRTDIWSFGVVLWEMLTGRRLFDGETVSHVLAAVLTKAPDWTMLPAQTPTPIRTLLRRCLEKDRKRRLADAADARLEIEEAPSGSATVDTSAAAPSSASMSRGRLIALAGGAAVLLSVITGAAVWTFTPREVVARATSRFALRFPPGVALIGNAAQKFAIARDGRHVVFNGASRDGVTPAVRAPDRPTGGRSHQGHRRGVGRQPLPFARRRVGRLQRHGKRHTEKDSHLRRVACHRLQSERRMREDSPARPGDGAA